MIDIKVKKLYLDAKLPKKATVGSAGYDLYLYLPTLPQLVIYGGEQHVVGCGFCMELPQGYEAQVRSRSGMCAKHRLVVPLGPGTVDSDYRGEVKVILENTGSVPTTVKHGDRIAQMVVNRVPESNLIEVENLEEN